MQYGFICGIHTCNDDIRGASRTMLSTAVRHRFRTAWLKGIEVPAVGMATCSSEVTTGLLLSQGQLVVYLEVLL